MIPLNKIYLLAKTMKYSEFEQHLKSELTDQSLTAEIENCNPVIIDECARDEKLEMLREIIMRCQLSFPQNEQDIKWFDEGINNKTDLLVRINEFIS